MMFMASKIKGADQPGLNHSSYVPMTFHYAKKRFYNWRNISLYEFHKIHMLKERNNPTAKALYTER